MSFKTVMERIGHDLKIGFTEVEKYLPAAELFTASVYPPSAPIIGAINVTNNLIIKAVAAVEAKYQAAGNSSGSGVQKSADVISIVGPIVIDTLKKAGVTVDATYIQSVINAAVALMQVPVLTTDATTTTVTAPTITVTATPAEVPTQLTPAPVKVG